MATSFRLLILTGSILTLAACSSTAPVPQAQVDVTGPDSVVSAYDTSLVVPVTQTPTDDQWVDSVLTSLTLRQKVAQMIFPKVLAHYFSVDSKHYLRIQKLIQTDEIGGLVVFQGDVMAEATLLNEFQAMSRLPLWVMQDTENGLAMRIRNATLFPHIMSLGAIDDTVLTYQYARTIALENRAVGIHHALAPVIDVNNNPKNPVINVRSFGTDPKLVARHGLAYVRGTEDGGQIATIKHFPGHGDTDTDSHISLPVLNQSMERLDSVELYPYRYILRHNHPSVMIGHLAVNPSVFGRDPATLNQKMIRDLLSDHLGFSGFLVSDAMDMGAIERNYGPVNAAIMAVKAGLDAIILPIGEEQVIDGIVDAVKAGEISESRINESVRKILEYKSEFNLHKNRYTSLADVRKVVARADHLSKAEEVAFRSLTLLKNENNLVPFSQRTPSRLLVVYLADTEDPTIDDLFVSELRRHTGKTVEVVLLDRRSNSLDFDVATNRVSAFNQIILVTNMNILSGKNRVQLSAPLRTWIDRNETELQKRNTILISLGNPFVINSIRAADAVIATYSISDNSQRAVVAALMGETPFRGKLPVSLDAYPIGAGIQTRLPEAGAPGEELICEREHPSFNPVAQEADEAILEGVAPGMAISVVSRDKIWYQKAFGRLTYETTSASVTCSTLYDLASLTKVFATTMSVMILTEEEKLSPDQPIKTWYTALKDTVKQQITIRQLLTHTSGFESWRPFHKLGSPSAEAILDTILNARLHYSPGDSSIYSDWNFILLSDIIRKVTGKTLDQFAAERIYQPLGLRMTGFNPAGYPEEQMAPTENDQTWRMKVVRGSVHDETAQLLGGVSGHAGLFSTIREISVLTQLMVNNGRVGDVRLFQPETVKLFTSSQGLPGGRALGWDVKSPKGYTSAGSIMGPLTYGHLGFTGNSVWIDPQAGYGIILLSNRVYPTRDNKKISAFRPKMYDRIAEIARKVIR
ncbi:MAG: serine hydrolase [Bacteroidetes bacterium]|nr:serine hydrolase [Bacteroidota bacterium]